MPSITRHAGCMLLGCFKVEHLFSSGAGKGSFLMSMAEHRVIPCSVTSFVLASIDSHYTLLGVDGFNLNSEEMS